MAIGHFTYGVLSQSDSFETVKVIKRFYRTGAYPDPSTAEINPPGGSIWLHFATEHVAFCNRHPKKRYHHGTKAWQAVAFCNYTRCILQPRTLHFATTHVAFCNSTPCRPVAFCNVIKRSLLRKQSLKGFFL
jgi:hypothetical protein